MLSLAGSKHPPHIVGHLSFTGWNQLLSLRLAIRQQQVPARGLQAANDHPGHALEQFLVLASDNVYLYENLDAHKPIAQTLDAVANLKAQDRMRTLASSLNLIVPGHDMERWETLETVYE